LRPTFISILSREQDPDAFLQIFCPRTLVVTLSSGKTNTNPFRDSGHPESPLDFLEITPLEISSGQVIHFVEGRILGGKTGKRRWMESRCKMGGE
jgi:hypothetical protein